MVKCSAEIDAAPSDSKCDPSEKPNEQRRCPMAENVVCKKRVIEIFDIVFKILRDNFMSLLNKAKFW